MGGVWKERVRGGECEKSLFEQNPQDISESTPIKAVGARQNWSKKNN